MTDEEILVEVKKLTSIPIPASERLWRIVFLIRSMCEFEEWKMIRTFL